MAEILSQENVVGWFQGRMEFSPRALGNRSILGDPRSSSMQSVMNLKIKYRESFRPFAPSVLSDRVFDYFELDRASPYMLLVAPVKEDLRLPLTSEQQELFGIEKLKLRRSTIPAVTHVDYTARIQTVHQETNPRYAQLINHFEQKTGCSLLVNTSFNVRGEPIVCTPEDAYKCFMRTEMDYLVMENFVLAKSDQMLREQNNSLPADKQHGLANNGQETSEPNQKELRNFGLLVGAFIAILFGLLLPIVKQYPLPLWPWIIAGILWFLAALTPNLLQGVYRLWKAIGLALGSFNTRLILGIIFYGLFTPTSLIMRLLNKDPMARKFDNDKESYRLPTEIKIPESMTKPF